MKVTPTNIPDVLLLEPKIFSDDRGSMMESYNQNVLNAALGTPVHFVQDNQSSSKRGVLRGLHYQIQNAQAKLIRVTRGEIFDVAVDLRQSSPTFGQWTGTVLSAENNLQIYIPAGFAHGFLVLSDVADCLYKVSDFYAPQHERCLMWNDPRLNISWPDLDIAPILSKKDRDATPFDRADLFE